MTVSQQCVLVAAADDDLASVRQLLRTARLPEPSLIAVQADATALDLPDGATQVIFVKCDGLRNAPALLDYLYAQRLEAQLILLTRTADFDAVSALAEPYAALVFDHAQHDARMLRQLVQFSARQRDLCRLIERNPDGMLVIDQGKIIRFANAAAAALFERPRSALIGAPFSYPLVSDQETEIAIQTQAGRARFAAMQLAEIVWDGQPAHLAALRDVTERSLMQQFLRRRLALESLLAEVSARFVSLPIAEVDAQIVNALAQLGQFIGAERALLVDFTVPPSPLYITHLWEAPHLFGRFPRVASEKPYRFYTETFKQQDILIIPDVQELPAEHPARDFLTVRGVRTLMAIAMHDGETLRGCLIFSSVSQPRAWQHEDAALLSIAADVFASTLRRAEINRALRESEARLRFVVSNAPIILFTFDRQGVVTFLEGSLLDRYFPDLRPWIGYSALEDPFIGAHLQRVLQGETCTVTFTPSAENALETYLTPLRDERGQVVGGIGVTMDITARQRAQEAERQKTLLLQTLAEASIALTSSLDRQHMLETILYYAERLVPCDGSTVVLFDSDKGCVTAARGRSSHMTRERWEAVFARMDVRAKIERLRQAGAVELIPNTDEAPNWLYIEGTEWIKSYLGLPIEIEGRVIGILNFDSATPNFFTLEHVERLKTLVGYAAIAIQNANLYATIQRNAKDLERHVRQRTHELEIERARLNAILSSIEESVVFFELQDTWRATYTNPAFHRLYGYHESEIVGKSVLEIASKVPAPDNAPSLEAIGQALERHGYWQSQLLARRKDGSTFDAQVAASKVTDLRGRFVGTVILVRDISAEKSLQAQKDRFIANAAHELRTPLTNLKMRLYLLRRQPAAADEHLRVIEQVTQRIQALVEDLLDVTRFERGMIALNRQLCRLQDVLQDVLDVQRPHFDAKGVQLQGQLPEPTIFVLADAERLVQVFTNLLVNALNYTQAQGQVCVRLSRDESSALVEVEDSGIGIDSESIKHIFEPFFRANLGTQRGTGLGLTIALEIVQAHGGSIEARSEVGVGTTMSVRLPLAQA
jgi:PAS domain S-box-containing protein